MTNYDKGKIYKIESDLGDLIYIGSTTKDRLSSRLAQHTYVYRNKSKEVQPKGKIPNYTSAILFDEYGIDNCRIVLLENCSCKSKDELTAREAHHIKSMRCVNKKNPGKFEWDHYYDEHKENIKARSKAWRESHLEYIKKRDGEKITCDCGSSIRKAEKSIHLKTQKHLRYDASKLSSSQTQRTTRLEGPLLGSDNSEAPNNTAP